MASTEKSGNCQSDARSINFNTFTWQTVILSYVTKISKESEDFIVEQYKRLRQRDGTGVTKSSWRITVRQLESMIRLSEAMARMHCCDEVSGFLMKVCINVCKNVVGGLALLFDYGIVCIEILWVRRRACIMFSLAVWSYLV